MPLPSRFLAPLAGLLAAASAASADPKAPTYDDDVLPILKQHCLGCHSADKQKGGLDVSTFAALKAGGSGGDVLKAGDPDKSRLFTLTAQTEEPKMPPKANRIPDAQLAVLKLWVEQGGRENAGAKVAMTPKPKVDIGLKTAAKGKPDGPPPMPALGKLPLDPVLVARRPNAVVALAASPWAPLVAVGGQRQVLLYHADTGALLGVLPFDGQINSLKFSRNGKLLLAAGGRGGASGKAVLYNVETGAKVTEVGSAESDAVLAADISADQSLIAVGTPTRMVRVYNTADGTVAQSIKKHTDWVTAVEFAPDGVLLATGDRNGGLFAWEAATGREFYALRGHTGMITDVSWRPDSNVLASSSEDGSVRLWEMENGTQIKTWGAHGGGTESVRYSMDGRIATTGRDRTAKLWDGAGTLQKAAVEPLPDLGLRVAVTHDNTKVVAGDWSGQVKEWTAADGKPALSFDANPPSLAARVQLAEQAVAGADAKAKQIAAARGAAEATAAKTAADLAAARKAVADTAAAATAAKAAVPVAKAAAAQAAEANKAAQKALATATAIAKTQTEKAATATTRATAAEAAKAAAAKTAAEKAVAAKAAADKAPTDAKLVAAVKVADAAAAKAQAELTAAQKATADVTAAGKLAVEKAQADQAMAQKAAIQATTATTAGAEKYAAAQKAAAEALAAAAAAPGKVPPLQQAATATAAAATAAQAADVAATAELTASKARFEQTKGVSSAVAAKP